MHSFLKDVSGTSWSLIEENCFVAGGFVRDAILGAPFNDIDIFEKGGREKVKEIVKAAMDNTAFSNHTMTSCSHGVGNATNLMANSYDSTDTKNKYSKEIRRANIQIVNTYHGTILDVLRGFDFHINEVAYDLKTRKIVFGEDCELARLVSTDFGDQGASSGDKICELSKARNIQTMKAGLNWDSLEWAEIRDGSSVEESSDVIRKIGLLINRAARLGNDLGGYGVDFSGSVDELTGRMLELTVKLMSKDDMDYDRTSYSLKDCMHVRHITGNLNIDKHAVEADLSDRESALIVKNLVLGKVVSTIKLGDSFDY